MPRMRQPIGLTPIFKNNKKRGQKWSQMAQPLGLTPNQEVNMPSKDKKVVGVKIRENDYEFIDNYANMHNISISAMLGLCVSAFVNGDLEVDKGELKMNIPEPETDISDEDFRENMRYKELRFDKLLSAFERKKYPDEAIRNSVEQIIGSVLDGPDYSSRRSNYDWGC